MTTYVPGEKFNIHCYKHNGNLHKIWDEAIFIENTEEYLIFANENVQVTTEDGKSWTTKEPAIMFFSKKNWFNIIGQIKKNGIFYYCNIASPYIVDGKTIKYIDYDLDLRVFNDGSFKILDRGEYKYHKRIMHYGKDIEKIIKAELTILINKVREKKFPFNKEDIYNYYNVYKKITEKNLV